MHLDPPKSCDLPFFAYGCFKPGEPAHRQLKKLLNADPKPALAKGALLVRDGLPILDVRNGSKEIEGVLLTFEADNSEAAYSVVSNFEPRSLYRWEQIKLLEPECKANCLVGVRPGQGSAKPMEDMRRWSHSHDPVFCPGMQLIREGIESFGKSEFHPAPPDDFDWPRFFKVQMLYLLLWSAIERFCSLAYGPALNPHKRIMKMANDPKFAEALAHEIDLAQEGAINRFVVDSRDPEDRSRLSADNPKSACEYYYQVRSNLCHRGKGAFKDGETVRRSLCELFTIFSRMLGHN